jgi:mRNA interferase RelE/StbE
VTIPPGERYNIRFQPAARRAISERLPESVAAAVPEFCEAALAVNPQRVGKPLFGPLAGCHGALRGTYRIVYRSDEASPSSTCSTSITAAASTTSRRLDRRALPQLT